MIVMLTALLGLSVSSASLQREPDIARPEMLSSEDVFPPIDDAAVLAFVKAPFDPKAGGRWPKWPRTLGMLRGVPVVISYTCSDLCPEYTKRIVRYNVAAGPDCDRIGGISKDIVVPRGIGAGLSRYCIPAVTDAWQE
ncbi:hypothetical protein FHS95_000231 [Sphingomonas naasensis]|uniref:Uncharacterized protein n=1 Tax=Sphingomonas naasensis TaxID=1344951 RepID=A0A4V3QXB5_9SPHN|nr:hypothetical protein [Sphingomonas naasensis]NIJ18562.1 hypothetical protein [Sphingomonas naasensis]TGX45812.1 hypothetical protein E5A74_01120 [Sphingomonas naasensis]